MTETLNVTADSAGWATPGPVARAHASYRHEALVCHGDEEFLAGTAPFLREAVLSGQPAMAAVTAPHLALLRTALGEHAGAIRFIDMGRLGHNPARIIPAWRAFVDEHGAGARPVRGVGEPVWAARRPAELAECQLHEALLNLAVHPDVPLWLRCPYDAATLSVQVLAAAQHSHPVMVDAESYRGSTGYGGIDHVEQLFGAELPEPPDGPAGLAFDRGNLAQVKDEVTRQAGLAGLGEERAADLALALHEVATNSLRYGGGRGRLRIWREDGALVCEVRDGGRIADPLVGRRVPPANAEGGRGLWLANQMCDLVQIRSTERGTAVRVLTWL